MASDDNTYDAFMAWYEKHGGNANLRMAFDAGYNACEKEQA